MSTDPNVTIKPKDDLGDNGLRIYICNDCKNFIPIPSDGTPPYKFDYLLHKIEDDHGFRGHNFAIVSVDKKAWEDTQGQKIIISQLKNAIAGGDTGLGSEFYEVKNQYHEDADACWKAHNRTLSCEDFKTPKKIIMPDTVKERRAEGLGEYRSNLHICNFCPMSSVIESRIRSAKVDKGMY